ncbi:MAG TPA: LysR family transcriptional regulator [Xanthobacteraceae bacterium]|nr:LysR family transcriptional regulator [Xanthobacteraceae bacterium]
MSMTPLDIPPLRQLRAFAAAARLESVSGAARAVNLSQPGLTQSLHALEARLAARLFDRRHSGCYVTPLGAILLPRVRRFFDHLDAALRAPMIGGPFAASVNKITAAQMRSLIAIAQSPSMEAAARRLDVAQPSLHRPARELERELRRSLLHRTAQGVTTNPQGAELARRFQVALREIAYGLEELAAAQGAVVARIAVGNIPHSGERILSAAIDALLETFPHAHVRVVDGPYEALLDDLRAGRLDLLFGVLRRPQWATDVTEERLFDNPYVVVARADHPLRGAARITPRALARYGWIMPEAGAPRRQAFARLFAGQTAPPVSIETTSLAIYRSVLAASDRLTLMSRLAARSDESAALAVLPFGSPHLHRADGIACRVDWQPTHVHMRFLALLRAEARRMAADGEAARSASGHRREVPG